MAGAVLGEVEVSLFVAGAVFGEVPLSLFVAGAVLGEIWKESRSAKCCIFHKQMRVASTKSNLGCAAGCGLTAAHCKRRLTCFQQICVKFWVVIFRGRHNIW